MDEDPRNASEDLARAQKLLTAIVGRILQTSDRKASVAMGAATQAVTGTAFAGAVTGASRLPRNGGHRGRDRGSVRRGEDRRDPLLDRRPGRWRRRCRDGHPRHRRHRRRGVRLH